MSGGGKTGADKLEGAWEFYGHMDRRWKADPCAPVDYYDPDASLTFPEALRLCCYAADYERGVRPPERRAWGTIPDSARRYFWGQLEAARPAARQVDALFERLAGEGLARCGRT